MDALTAWRGKGLLAACAIAVLAGWGVKPARADSLTVRLMGEAPDRQAFPAGSSAAEFGSSRESATTAEEADEPANTGDVFSLFVLGTVLLDSPGSFSAQQTQVDNPLPPGSTPPFVPPSNVTPPPVIDGGPPPSKSPEPASLFIGLIGSAFAGATLLKRRWKKADPV